MPELLTDGNRESDPAFHVVKDKERTLSAHGNYSRNSEVVIELEARPDVWGRVHMIKKNTPCYF